MQSILRNVRGVLEGNTESESNVEIDGYIVPCLLLHAHWLE